MCENSLEGRAHPFAIFRNSRIGTDITREAALAHCKKGGISIMLPKYMPFNIHSTFKFELCSAVSPHIVTHERDHTVQAANSISSMLIVSNEAEPEIMVIMSRRIRVPPSAPVIQLQVKPTKFCKHYKNVFLPNWVDNGTKEPEP